MIFPAWNVVRMENTAPTSKGPTTLEMLLRMDGVMVNSRKATVTATHMSHSLVANAMMIAEQETVSHTNAPKVLSLKWHISVSTGTAMYCAKIPRRLNTTSYRAMSSVVQPNSFLQLKVYKKGTFTYLFCKILSTFCVPGIKV